MIRLSEFISSVAEAAINKQNSDGSMPPGQNGPYLDQETPVRNTAHWLITFLNTYENNGNDRFKCASNQAVSYLLSADARPYDYTFYHRNSPEKDYCNGLVGQAWVIEALAEAFRILGREDVLKIAEYVFLLHPFDNRLGLWKKVEVNGDRIGYDTTFNHQLWFAAAGALLSRHEVNPKIEHRVEAFLDKINSLIKMWSNGLIKHRSLPEFSTKIASSIVRNDLRFFVLNVLEWTNTIDNSFLKALFNSSMTPVRRAPLSGKDHKYKSTGYHSFNLYAMAILCEQFPNHDFWSSDALRKALSYMDSDDYKNGLEGNKFAYGYNPPGFEVAFALDVFCGDESRNMQESWIERQLKRTYNSQTKQLDRKTVDPATLTARVYEVTRLSEAKLSDTVIK